MVRNEGRRGNAAVTALSLTGLLGFGALAVDVGYVQVVNAQLTVAVQAGALGGTSYLDGTLEGVDIAREQAAALVLANPVLGGFTLGAQDVQVGAWTEEDGFQEVTTVTTANVGTVNAIRIATHHGTLSAILSGAAFGMSHLSTRAEALAVRSIGAPTSEVECYLPMVIPQCALPENPTTNPAPLLMRFNNQNLKNIAWAHPDGANADNMKSHFTQQGLCGTSMVVGDEIPISNGTMDSAGELISDILNEKGFEASDWPYEQFPGGPPNPRTVKNYAFAEKDSSVTKNNWGNVISAPIALVDLGGAPGTCTNNGRAKTKLNGKGTITGFAWAYIYDRKKAGGADAHLYVQVDLMNPYEVGTQTDPGALGNLVGTGGPPVLVK